MSRPAGALDSLGMFELTAALPEQVADAVALADDVDTLPPRDAIENVLVLGMGGSGIAGDLLVAVAGPFMPVPVVVVKSYSTPSFVGPSTLCFAISFSGNTEETVEAATEAAHAGAHMVMLSHAGALEELAREFDAPHIRLPDIAMPRAAIGAVSVPTLVVLERLGLFPGAREWIDQACSQLRRRRDELIRDDNAMARLARAVHPTMPVIYGGNAIGDVAARRWKCQVNENAKAPAWAGTVPEMNHNEICGWGQHGDVTRQAHSYIELRHELEHPQVSRRFDIVRDLIAEVVHDVHMVEAAGEGSVAQLLDLVIQGDFFSLHLAYEAGVDPGPIPVLEDIKAALAPGG